MVAEGLRGRQSAADGTFATQYGVMESIEKVPDADNACTRSAKSDVRLVRRPGASPLVFGKFLMGSTAFVTLEDIADYLPSYEESVHRGRDGRGARRSLPRCRKGHYGGDAGRTAATAV